MSLFLEYPFADRTPEHLAPKASFRIIVKNHKDSSKDVYRATTGCPTFTQGKTTSWGFSHFIPIADMTTETGYLRIDGTLVIRLELTVEPTRKRAHELGSDFLALLRDPGLTSDFTLRAGDRAFPVHRAILAARCPYFRTLFSSRKGVPGADIATTTSRELLLPNTSPEALDVILRYVYGDVLTCPPELLKPAAELADRWQLAEALEVLQQQVGDATTVGTVVDDILWASAQQGADVLSTRLESLYVMDAAEVPEEDVMRLAQRNPTLMGKLHIAVARSTAKLK